MSRLPITNAVAIAASAVLLVSLAVSAAPLEDKPDKAARAEARVEAKAQRKAAKAAAKAERKAAKAERKQAQQKPEKVTLCHKPDTSDEVTITVGAPAVEAHVGHGDYVGECGAPAIVVTVSGPSVINPEERLKLVGEATGTTGSEVTYGWSSTCFTDAQLVDPLVIASRPSSLILVIREDVMTAGSTCAFTLTVTDGLTGRLGSASVDVTINQPPAGGSITVTPSSGGIALETLFHLEAPGWTDPDSPLYHQFFYTPAGSEVKTALTQLQSENRADAYLPAGDLEVSVKVSDSLGATSAASTSVTVLEP